MELWIRSQNCEDLSKVEHLGVYDKKIYINGYEEHGYCIGEYATKERALEVLDDIQKLLIPTYKFIANKDLDGNDIKVYGVEYINSYVYEMPKE